MNQLVAQSWSTLCNPMYCSSPGSSVYGILQARTLERVTIPFFRGSSWPRDQTQVSWIAGRSFTTWAAREAGDWTRVPCIGKQILNQWTTSDVPTSKIEPHAVMWKRGACGGHISIPMPAPDNTSSVQFSHSVVSDSLRPHELQHARPPYPSPTPGVHSDSRPSSRWCHQAISSSVIPFSSCPQSFPASESFPMSQLFAWGGQSTGVSALASFLSKNTQDWSPSEWTGWISLQSKGLSRVFSNTTVQKHQLFSTQLSSQSNSHIHTWPQEKP